MFTQPQPQKSKSSSIRVTRVTQLSRRTIVILLAVAMTVLVITSLFSTASSAVDSNSPARAENAGTVSLTREPGVAIRRTNSTGGTTKFIYDGVDVVRDLDGTGATIADYLNGLGVDQKLRQTTSGTSSYVLTDQLQTSRLLSDANGLVSFSVAYDSFGNISAGGVPTRYTFTGREIDSETGMLYYRARWYDSNQGRFSSEDPIGFRARDINLYRYVQGNPLQYVDPTGLRRCNPLLGAIIGGLVGGVSGAVAGAGLGAVAGAVAGGAGGTLVAPGVGTIAGGGGGAGAGATVGAIVGSGIGVGLGIGLGIDYCRGNDDTKDKCDTYPRAVPNPTPRATPNIPPPPPPMDPCVNAYEACLGWAAGGATSNEQRLRRRLCSQAYDQCKRGGVTVKFPDGTVVRP